MKIIFPEISAMGGLSVHADFVCRIKNLARTAQTAYAAGVEQTIPAAGP